MKVSDFVKTHSKVKHIDFMISLGPDCRPNINIQCNGFRYFSAPLDAVGTRSLKTTLHLYESKFADFFSRYEIVYDNKTTTNGFWVEDTINNAFSIHDFMKDMPVDESYRRFKEKIGRRAKRLDDMLKSANKIVLVAERLETKDEIIWFLKEFSNLYPNLDIELINIRNDTMMDFDEINEERIIDEQKLSYTEYFFNDTRKCMVVPEGNIELWSKVLLQYENDNLSSLKKAWKEMRNKYPHLVLYGNDRKVARVANWLSNIGIIVDLVAENTNDINIDRDSCIMLCIDDKKNNGNENISHLKSKLSDKGYHNVMFCDNFLRIISL